VREDSSVIGLFYKGTRAQITLPPSFPPSLPPSLAYPSVTAHVNHEARLQGRPHGRGLVLEHQRTYFLNQTHIHTHKIRTDIHTRARLFLLAYYLSVTARVNHEARLERRPHGRGLVVKHQSVVHLVVPGVVLLGQLAGVRAAPRERVSE